MLRAPLSFATTIIIGALYHVPQDKTILAISNNNWGSTNKSYQLYPRFLLRRTSINKNKGAYVITCQHSLFVFSKKETNGFVFHILAALCGARGCFWDSCLVSASRRNQKCFANSCPIRPPPPRNSTMQHFQRGEWGVLRLGSDLRRGPFCPLARAGYHLCTVYGTTIAYSGSSQSRHQSRR